MRRSSAVHKLHQGYGDVVRIQSNRVSISRPEALQQIYGHEREYPKGPYYEDEQPSRRDDE